MILTYIKIHQIIETFEFKQIMELLSHSIRVGSPPVLLLISFDLHITMRFHHHMVFTSVIVLW